MNSSEKAAELFNYYLSHLAIGLTATKREAELAKEFAINHCERTIIYIEQNMQGWLDTDFIIFWGDVKKVLSTY